MGEEEKDSDELMVKEKIRMEDESEEGGIVTYDTVKDIVAFAIHQRLKIFFSF